jgi:hypothetical protein
MRAYRLRILTPRLAACQEIVELVGHAPVLAYNGGGRIKIRPVSLRTNHWAGGGFVVPAHAGPRLFKIRWASDRVRGDGVTPLGVPVLRLSLAAHHSSFFSA